MPCSAGDFPCVPVRIGRPGRRWAGQRPGLPRCHSGRYTGGAVTPRCSAQSSAGNRVRQGYPAMAKNRFRETGVVGQGVVAGHRRARGKAPLRDSLVSSDNARAREAHDWLGKAADDLGSCRALMVSGYLGQRALLLPAGCRKEPEGIPDLSRQDAPAHARHRTTWRNMLPDRRHAGFAPRRSRCPF